MSVFTQAGGGANQLDTGYEISNSLRFNDDDSPNLTERPVSGNRKTFTFSTWIKRGNLKPSGEMFLLGGSSDGATDHTEFKLQNDQLTFIIFDGSSNTSYIRTTAKLRDVSAWYHVVFRIDLTQATNTDRIRLYINGDLQTDLDQTTYDAQNNDSFMSLGNGYHRIGADARSAANFFDGYMAETYYIDGQSYDPTYFGKFDDNNVWIPVEPGTGDGGSITYGTNGFLLEYKQTGTSQNASGIGADTSGQDNHFAVTNLGATDVTEDTPTNNFATLSSIDTHTTSPTLAEGNTDFTGVNGTVQTPARSTIAVSSGKWYMEYKYKTADGGVGIMTTQSPINDHLRDDADVRSLWRGSSGGYYYGRNESGAIDAVGDNSETFSADDIGMIALDLDNGNVYFGKNGTWFKGQDGSTTGVPTSGSSGTGSANHPSQLLTDQHDGVWAFMAFDRTQNSTGRVICNFGNIPSTVSSPNTDGKYGKFYYAPPSGYYALCTKRLAVFG